MRERSTRGYLTGAARLGYSGSRTALGSKPVPDSEVGPLIQETFAKVASGQSLRQVTTWLAERGVRGVRGGPVGLATVQRMLTDPFYAGFVSDRAGCLARGQHEALIARHTFARAQRKLLEKRCYPMKPDETLLSVD